MGVHASRRLLTLGPNICSFFVLITTTKAEHTWSAEQQPAWQNLLMAWFVCSIG